MTPTLRAVITLSALAGWLAFLIILWRENAP